MADLSDEKLREVFETFDKNNDGFIDEFEAKGLFEALGLDTSKLEVELLISQFDEDGNKLLDFNEFKKAVLK